MASFSLGAVALAAVLAASTIAGCGTDAVGVDACRSIEQARCQKAPSCPALGITGNQGVEECAQFARDRCLHGTAVADPGAAAVDACVKAIAADATCAIVAAPETAPACAFLLGSATAQDASVDATADAAAE
jgi:hypothetical protein